MSHGALLLCDSLDGRGVWGEPIHVCVWLSPFAVHLKLSQLCLLIDYTLIQNKKLKKNLYFSHIFIFDFPCSDG